MRKTIRLITVLAIPVLCVAGMYAAVQHYLVQAASKSQMASCRATGTRHLVTITGGKLSSAMVQGKLCDTLTITNEDNRLRLIAFGPHDHHVAYDGTLEKLLAQGQSLTVTFNQTGRFSFHDHLEDAIIGYFTVSQ